MKEVNQHIIYRWSHNDFGNLNFRKMDVETDSHFLHDWVTRDYAFFWGMQQATLTDVQSEYHTLVHREAYDVFIIEHQDAPVCVLERYHPEKDEIGNHYDVQASDCGIHVIVAPPGGKTISNFTWYIFSAITSFIFNNQRVTRILVEPDIRNKKMFAICERVGFQLDKVVELPHKTAQLAFCSRTNYQTLLSNQTIEKRSVMNTVDNAVSPQQAISHITPKSWQTANRLLIKKALCEFSHELLIQPKVLNTLDNGWNKYQLEIEDTTITYTFEAKPLALNHLFIKTNSITKLNNDEIGELDAVLFIKELKPTLGISDSVLPVYLEEIISTLYGSAYKLVKGNPTVDELVHADFQTIEQAMMEGHPGFVANNGRIGFNSSEYRSYAPEAGNLFSVLWLAGRKNKAIYAAEPSLPYEQLLQQELDSNTIESFKNSIREKEQDPEDYFFFPIHPWQWFNKVANIFASDIAQGHLICLGYGPDQYLAQQSIRTLFNTSNPHKFYVKSALSILNMGFMRGLPHYYLGTAPKMAVWLEELLYQDAFIQETGFKMLSEIASVSFVNTYFEELGPHNDYNKMLASLWRQSPYQFVNDHQTPITMAALLHIDHEGNALLPEFIKVSGLSIDDWLAKYLKAYLSPLLHCFYHFDLVFMPHGENIILVMENGVPQSILLKDITEEAVILNPEVALPDHLKRMYAPVPEDVKLLSIFTDVFDGFFRFMAHILEEHANYDQSLFWNAVAKCVDNYQSKFPVHWQKFEKYDLFAPAFKLSCLNRLQLHNNKQMIDLDDPVALLQFAGMLDNPLAKVKELQLNAEV